MEIFIIGVVIVALMVYVSTKIKKSAAQAFERETIETEDFTLVKPEGFMHPLRDESEFAFEAFSKDFGDGELRNIWQANVELLVHSGTNLKEICSKIRNFADSILSEEKIKETPADQRISLIEGEITIDDVHKHVFWKVVESVSQKKVFELRAFVLESNLNDHAQKIEEMFESFRVK